MRNKELARQKRQDDWEKTKYFLDKATAMVLSPPGMLVGGFVLTNYLQHAKMMDVDVTNGVVVTEEKPWWALAGTMINPLFMLIPPQKTVTNYPGGTQPMTFLTDDQANVLRAGLVTQAAATSGLLGGILDTLTGLVKK